MKRCKTCGRQLGAKEKFCTGCGQEYKIFGQGPEQSFELGRSNKNTKQVFNKTTGQTITYYNSNETKTASQRKVITLIVVVMIISTIVSIFNELTIEYKEAFKEFDDYFYNEEDDTTYAYLDEINLGDAKITFFTPVQLQFSGKNNLTISLYIDNERINEPFEFDIASINLITDNENTYKLTQDETKIITVNPNSRSSFYHYQIELEQDEELSRIEFIYNDITYTIKD